MKFVSVTTASHLTLAIAALLNWQVASSQQQGEASGFSAASVDPAVVQEDLEPSVEIQQFENRRVEEYSQNGHVYMIKITPTVGASYYLVDPDGTGEMEWRRDTLGMEVNPPRWTLFRW